MAKLSEIVYNLYESLKPGFTDDSILSMRQLEFIVNHYRAKIVSQRYNTNKSLDGFAQSLIDLKMERSKDFKVMNNAGVLLKSKSKIPQLVNVSEQGFALNFVGMRNQVIPFQKTSVQLFNSDMYNPFVQNCYFIDGGYFYVVTKNLLFVKEVYMRGYFESPREVLLFNKEIDEYEDMDWEYPVSTAVLDQINSMVVNGEFRFMNLLPKDDVNDGIDEQRNG